MLPRGMRRADIPQSQWDAWAHKRKVAANKVLDGLQELDSTGKLMDLPRIRMFLPQLVRLVLEAEGSTMKVAEINAECARAGYHSIGCKDSTFSNALHTLKDAGELRQVSHGWFAIGERQDRPPRSETVYSNRSYRDRRSGCSSPARSSTSRRGGKRDQPSSGSAPPTRRRKRLLVPPPQTSTTPYAR